MDFEGIDETFERMGRMASVSAIRRSLRLVTQNYEVLSFDIGRGKIFWRAQGSPTESGHDLAARMSYPPTSLATRGRMNEEGLPCLYLSARIEGALSEIGANAGDVVHLTGFRIIADKTINVGALGEMAHVQKTGYLKVFGSDPGQIVSRMLNSVPKAEALRKVYVDSYLASYLADVDAELGGYRMTRAITQHVYGKVPGIRGIFYPSVKRDLAMNLAVLPSAADECLQQAASIVVRVHRVLRFGFYDFEILRSAEGINDHGAYAWSTTTPPSEFLVFNMTKSEFEAGQPTKMLLDLPAHQALS